MTVPPHHRSHLKKTLTTPHGSGGGMRPSRRAFLGGTLAAAVAASMTGCGTGRGASQITFFQSKPEAIPYFQGLAGDFNDIHSGEIRVVHDATSDLAASFARGNPPDLGCLNYNYETVRFQEGGALRDLSHLSEIANIDPAVTELADAYPSYPGRTSTIPYSMMGAAVLYNEEIFEQHSLQVPTTYSEFLEVCGTLDEAGVPPIYSTFGDPWTVSQGLVDYSVGGTIDVADFFERLRAQGSDAGPDAEVSFSKELREPLEKMLEIASYSQRGAPSRGYGDGNLAFARGEAAMYMQGPWALFEVQRINPDLQVGLFPLPMTEDPADLRVRVNIDLALWIPEGSDHPQEAEKLLEFLIQPEVADAYNHENLAFGVRADAPEAEDRRLQDLQPYIDDAAFYLGVSQQIPRTITFESYSQGLVLGQSLEGVLRTLDEDWARLARRTS